MILELWLVTISFTSDSLDSILELKEVVEMATILPVIAGTISTTLFALSLVPMLLKAWRTKDLQSYSLDSMVLTNVANVVHSVYVFSLPPGPIWLLHSFYLVTSAVLLGLYLRHAWRPMCGRLARFGVRWLRETAGRVTQFLQGAVAVAGEASCPI
jgi:uncharacterized protein with PQ loop repeat